MPATAAPTPRVHVIAGPNGAGKTTFATDYLPSFANCREFVNADLIASGLSPFAHETQATRAGRLVLARIHELAASGADFAFGTTLSGRAHAPILSRRFVAGSTLGREISLHCMSPWRMHGGCTTPLVSRPPWWRNITRGS